MSDDSIRLSEEVKGLDRHKRAGESYEDVILRLTERDPWAGFGALAECDQDTRGGWSSFVKRCARDCGATWNGF